MEQAEMTIFIILANLVVLIFVAGTIVFIYQFRQKRMKHEMEKTGLRERHLLELVNTQLAVQHDTMQHIGSEIHDSVGQKLTLAVLYARQLVQGRQFPELEEKVERIGNIVNESLEELRQLSRTLNNPALSQNDLLALLQHECRQVNAAGICQASLEVSAPSIPMAASVKHIVFRIVQEFMQNSLKHAQCQRLHIQVQQENGLRIEAADDGVGFDTSQPPRGIGLGNMKRRALQIGATLELHSSPGAGTRLTLQLPATKMEPGLK
ncbi:sensor histidine kinase [Chitinophaga caseinilytica]|uniref:Oxygen sensor histidine kinase NreB n=1 Tax=Chitinophaga caseinilytica TaxID=2267521 RepID=A0ABZ2Z0V9_9BACT